nr:uncharacterized protein LOC117987255 [Maniola hyperantus]
MDALFNLQCDVNASIEKAFKNFKKSPKDRLTWVYIETRLESLESLWSDFVERHKEIVAAPKSDLKARYFTDDYRYITEEMYTDYKAELKGALVKTKEVSKVSHESDSSTSGNVKLPKITIPIFSGDYTSWTSFKDLFISVVHKNESLDNVQKLHYLKGQLSGEAEQLLRHINISGDNYEQCWTLLQNRYDNKKFLANCWLKRLINQNCMSVESANGIKNILDTTVDSLNALKNLGVDVTSWDILVIFLTSSKLDSETRKQWELSTMNSSSELPSFKEFKDFLEGRYRALEYIDEASTRKQSTYSKPKVLHAIESQSSVPMVSLITSSELSSTQELSPSNEGTPAKITSHLSTEGDFSRPGQVLLATAIVKADASNGNSQMIRVLLDQGSTSSFITEATVQLLGLKKVPARSEVMGLGGNQSACSQNMVQLTIHSIHDPTFTIQIKAHILKTITSLLPSEKISSKKWIEIKDVFLADPEFHTPNKIDVLLGAEVYAQVIREGLIRGPPGAPIAQNTAFGWILSGQTDSRGNSISCHHITVTTHMDENDVLKKFWELETEHSFFKKNILTPEEETCEQFYERSTKRDKDGRYIVRLPFRDEDPQCKYGNSRDIAIKRFQMLERKFEKNPEVKTKYSEVIHEYLDLDHMIRVQHDEDPKDAEAVYLPHHAVIREDKSTTKVRIVFDASCKYANNVSLNDSLMVGPKLQPDLRHIIMRWRCHPICLIADLVKMYRQVKIAEEDTNFQRIVWRDNPQSEIEDYKLVRVTFGTAAAPYLAVKTLQQLAIDEGANYPTASVKTKSDYYVDDLMTGCETVEEGIQLYKEMTRLMAKGGFQLQKWVTNDETLAKKIMAGKIEDKEVDIKTDEILKILGLTWNRTHDAFKYSVQLPPLQTPVTKRKVISDISRLFDPLGWVAPVIIEAKTFIQTLWLSGIEWDEELPNKLLKTWTTYRENLLQISEVQFPRWIWTKSSDMSVEIHGFCDASTIAYAAVVYLRVVDKEGNVKTSLIAARTKVAPVKQVSVPRLELCGAVLLAKLIREVSEVLIIPKLQLHAWTDSTVVLSWLGSHPSRWNTFVGNRVSEILSILDNTQWAHIPTSQNPADIASRGMIPTELAHSKLWKEGPSLLKTQIIEYSKPRDISTDLEKRAIKAHLVTSIDEDEIWTKFSSLQKLIRVIAYCRRFLNLRKTAGEKRNPTYI